MLLLDLQRIRKEKKLTQLRLSELTGYPQGFISKMERGQASAPEEFLKRLQEALKLPDLRAYLVEGKARELRKTSTVLDEVEEKEEPTPTFDQADIVANLFAIISRRDARIEKLEDEIERLRAELDAKKRK